MGTSIFPSNVTGVTVETATSGALSGDGSSGNKLAVIVDGVTVTVNGSNQLVAASGGTPGGSDTQIQFNDSGAFAGDAGFTWGGPSSPQGLTAILTTSDDFSLAGEYAAAIGLIKNDAYDSGSMTGLNTSVIINAGSSTGIYGIQSFVLDQGSDHVDAAYAVLAQTNVISPITTDLYGGYFNATTSSSVGGSIYGMSVVTGEGADTAVGSAVYGYHYADSPDSSGRSVIPALYGVWINDISGSGPHPYGYWLDSPGVYRINGSGVPGQYNPAFTKYVPGAYDFERMIQQWNGSVAEFGNEASGSGSQVTQRFKGSDFSFSVGGIPEPNEAPTLTSGAAGSVTNGIHRVGIVFVNGNGTTRLGPQAVMTVSGNTRIELSDIPLAPGDGTDRRIYVSKNNQANLHFVASLGNNVATTYSFNTADASLNGGAPPSVNTTALDVATIAADGTLSSPGLTITGLSAPTNAPVCFDASGNLYAGTNTGGVLSCP